MAVMRGFVGIVPPGEVCDALGALPRESRPGLRWTRPDQWHVTLRFLGSVTPDEAIEALARLDATAVDVELGPVVERLGRGVVMVPASGVDDLARAVRQVTAGVGRPEDPTRPFHGHLTLARLRGRTRCGLIGTRFSVKFRVGEVHLMRSDPGDAGPVYSVVATRALG